MKHNILAIFVFMLTLAMIVTALVGCQKDNTTIILDSNYNELFTEDELIQKGHVKTLPEYFTDSSIAFLNEDGSKTLYVYASPIRFLNRQGEVTLIDTRLTNITEEDRLEEDYLYTVVANDIIPLYPEYLSDQKGVKLIGKFEYEIGVKTNKRIESKIVEADNFINDKKNMVFYENGDASTIYFYPSNIGTNCEITFNSSPVTNVYSLWLKVYDESINLRKGQDGTIIISNSKSQNVAPDEILGVIQEPILKSSNMEVSYDSSLEIEKIDNVTYNLNLIFDEEYLEENAHAFISFEMRRDKQPDNAMYSGKPYWTNTYLKNYSVIGNSKEFGIGRLFIRFPFITPLGLESSQIIDAKYCTYSLTENEDTLELVRIMEEWCSLTGNWSNNYKLGERISSELITGKELTYNITEGVKIWCDDSQGILEQHGLSMKSSDEEKEVYNIFLTNDNSLYPCRTEITFKE